jgi:hypothetical protein
MRRGLITPRSPYLRWNLLRNPFGELTRHERAELAVVDVAMHLAELQVGRTALQFLGDQGRGKTTHLLAIGRALPGASYVYLPEDGPRPRIPRARPLLLDEAQRLSRWQRYRVFAVKGPLVIGSHEDHTQELERAGHRVVTHRVADGSSPERLHAMLNRRIKAARADVGPLPLVSEAFAAELQAQFGPDLRGIEQFLYDLFQSRLHEDPLWPVAG